MYNIQAIPTKYGGVQFRSRLEARWAAFFDFVGLKWEYEPLELNGWFPDFRVLNPLAGTKFYDDEDGIYEIYGVEQPALAEVKLFYKFWDGQGELDTIRYMFLEEEKIEHALGSSSQSVVLLGNNPDSMYWIGDNYSVNTALYDDRRESLWREAGNITQWKR